MLFSLSFESNTKLSDVIIKTNRLLVLHIGLWMSGRLENRSRYLCWYNSRSVYS